MTYAQGGLIQATDYNGFVSTTAGANINSVLSAYGQPTVSTVATSGSVTATQWSTLNSAISTMANHQGTAITARSNPTAGSIVTALAAVAADLTAVNTNYANAAAQGTQYTAWTGSSSKTTSTAGSPDPNSPWTITFTHYVNFANTTSATNFFNAGGTVRIQFSKTSTGTPEDTAWNTLVNSTCGQIVLAGVGASKTIAGQTYRGVTVVGGSGTPTTIATNTGVLQLTTTPTILYQQYDAGAAYSSNYVQVVGSVSGSTLALTTTWFDDGTGTNPLVPSQISGGTPTTGISLGTAPTTLVTYTPPSTAFISNTWGTPTISASVA